MGHSSPQKFKKQKTFTSQDVKRTLAAIGAKNNDELNDDKNNAKKRKGEQQKTQLSLWEQPTRKKANQNNNPH